MYYNMNDIDVRSSNNFLRKVFLYMILGIAVSFGTGIYLYNYNKILLYTLMNYYPILLIAELVMVLSLTRMLNKMSTNIARILFFAYSLVNGVTLTVIGFIYAPQVIFYAFMITLVIFVVMAIYGYTTQEDLSSYRRFFMVALISLIILSIINIFLKKVARENRIPFELSADPFYSRENMAELERRINSVRSGESTLKEHELIEVD